MNDNYVIVNIQTNIWITIYNEIRVSVVVVKCSNFTKLTMKLVSIETEVLIESKYMRVLVSGILLKFVYLIKIDDNINMFSSIFFYYFLFVLHMIGFNNRTTISGRWAGSQRLISVLKDENKNIAKCKVIIDSITVWFLSLVERREDPFTLLIRFIGMMGIRVLDLFRIFESGANSIVTKENFIRGVKVILCFICAFLLLMLCIK